MKEAFRSVYKWEGENAGYVACFLIKKDGSKSGQGRSGYLEAPIVAKCDRKRFLSSWSPYCRSVAPAEFHVEFSSVRQLSPTQFVEKLAKEFGVHGVVAGIIKSREASELVRLCKDYGMGAYIAGSVMDKNQLSDSLDSKDKGQVSFTRVRCALAEGDVKYVSELLGRSHRLMLVLPKQEGLIYKRNGIGCQLPNLVF